MAGLVHRQNGEKQIGCMSSFLQIFNRKQILARKRLNSSADVGGSPVVAAQSENENGRLTVDGDENPPSVIAKHIDCNNFQLKQPNQSQKQSKSESMHVGFEKTLKIRGIDQQLNDLNTFKQILQVLQLKGLLNSTSKVEQWQSLTSKVEQHRSLNKFGSERSPLRSRTISPIRIQSNLKSCNPISKQKPLSIETIDTIDSERSRWEDCRDGKRLLERCGKLLHSIAEMNRTTESPPSSVILLPSPVSVLDSGFDKDESSSPSHSIDFKATSTVDFDEENWSPKTSPTEQEEFISDDPDFIYISEILGASQHLRDDSTVFLSIEKQLYNSDTTSTVSKRHRKLIFDVIFEMLDRNRQLPPWKTSRASVKHIWNEFQRIREMVINTGNGDGLVELISSVLKKDLVEVKDWDEYPIDTSEVILETERLIFKDLVSEVIRDVGEYSGECKLYRSRRKLVF